MTAVTAAEARRRLPALLDEVAQNHQPVVIVGKHSNGVLISERDWNGIRETLYLSSIPGMVESIKEGMATPTEEMSETLEW